MENIEVNFDAILYSTRSDRDGEWKITLTVPSSELPSILRLATWTETVLTIKAKRKDVSVV